MQEGNQWSERFSVTSHDVDFDGTVRPSNLLRFHQEAAHLQLEGLGPNEKTLREKGQAFLLSRIAMRICMPLYDGDSLEARTWGCASPGVRFFRCGQILHGGRVAAELVSTWALMDIVEGKPLRASDALPDFPTDAMLDIGVPQNFRIPGEVSMEKAGEYRVGYGVTDRNCHMNNTFYPDLLCDFLPGGMEGKRVESFSIHYVNEAHYRSSGEVFAGRGQEGVYYFRTVREDGKTGIEAWMHVEDRT